MFKADSMKSLGQNQALQATFLIHICGIRTNGNVIKDLHKTEQTGANK